MCKCLSDNFENPGFTVIVEVGGGGVLPIMAFLGGSAHRGPFLRVEVYKRVGTSQSKSLNSSIAKWRLGV